MPSRWDVRTGVVEPPVNVMQSSVTSQLYPERERRGAGSVTGRQGERIGRDGGRERVKERGGVQRSYQKRDYRQMNTPGRDCATESRSYLVRIASSVY